MTSALMVDLANDSLLTLTQAAGALPRRRGGKKPHVSTLYRWTTSGCRGIRLRYVQIGATRCTTREWLADFFEALTAASDGPEPSHPVSPNLSPLSARTSSVRRRAVERANRELEALGV